MNKLDTIWRLLVTSLAVWRLSRVLFRSSGNMQAAGAGQGTERAGRFWAGRAVDLAWWTSIWLSGQTAIWIACGLAGVLLIWLGATGISRLLMQPEKDRCGLLWASPSADAQDEDRPCLRCGEELQAHHG